MIQGVSRIRALRWVPRGLLIVAEAYLIRTTDRAVFDGAFYLDRNPDVKASGLEPLDHYLKYGWREQRSPNSDFDDGYYRLNAGLSPETPVSALGHFVAFGQARGFAPTQALDLKDWRKRNPEIDIARGAEVRLVAYLDHVLGPVHPANTPVDR